MKLFGQIGTLPDSKNFTGELKFSSCCTSKAHNILTRKMADGNSLLCECFVLRIDVFVGECQFEYSNRSGLNDARKEIQLLTTL